MKMFFSLTRAWRCLSAAVLLTSAAAASQAITVAVVATGNFGRTGIVASWIEASGRFTQVTAFDVAALDAAQVASFDELLFFTNTSGNPSASGNALAQFAATGKRTVVATFAWAGQNGNTVGGAFVNDGWSPFVRQGSTLYRDVTLAGTDHSPLFGGVNGISGHFHDDVTVAPGAVLRASWSDGSPLVASRGNVIGINLFPDDGWGQISGDQRQLFINALALPGGHAGQVSAVPEPNRAVLMLVGLLSGGVFLQRRAVRARR